MASSDTARIQLALGDITKLDVDAIVTAANSALRGGGGVDGAVHRAAGSQLVEASLGLAPCPPGQARITPGFQLAAAYVIHAVGPIFRSLQSDSLTLASAYRESLLLAEQHDVSSIAFPCISTGVYGFPAPEACRIAIDTVTEWLGEHEMPRQVVFCCFSDAEWQRYRERLDELKIAWVSPGSSGSAA